MSGWDPDGYLRFGDERLRPSLDLLARVPDTAPGRVIDLGCGPGNSTEILWRRWQCACVTGIDNSREMIAAAKERYPERNWVLGDLAEWEPRAGEYDVVFSNAALQWLPDHTGLVRRLFGAVAPGGTLAFQVPSATYSPVRASIHEIALDPEWVERMGGALSTLTMEEPGVYYDVLSPLAASLDIWETEYLHVLDSPSAVVDWIASTGLRPFLGALETEPERARFVRMLHDRVEESYPRRADGRVLMPFRRVFVVATAGGAS
jgi:trans-aconitate 2-methyltransferase